MKEKVKNILLGLAVVISVAALITAICVSSHTAEKGQSAYELALENGYVGTEAEWLASLKGENGENAKAPTIEINGEGYWVINGTVANVKAVGEDGQDGNDGKTGATGNGIASIAKTASENNVDTYTITFTDNSTTTFTVTNGQDGTIGETGATGNGIASIAKTSSQNNIDTYTITFTDNSTTTFTVTNGQDLTACEHVYGDWSKIEPTCSSLGYSTRSCSKCGNVEYEFAEALGHNWEICQTLQVLDCEHDGKYYYMCKTCGLLKYVLISTEGHNYENKVCTKCGKLQPSEGLLFSLSEDKTYYIVSAMGTCTDVDVVIPDTYNNLPVQGIGKEAFGSDEKNKENTTLTSVVIPDSVKIINDYAFEQCTALKNVTMGNGVETIGVYSFAFCSNLTSVTLGDSIKTIGDGAFASDSLLKNIIIPDSVKTIGSASFWCCYQLESVTFGKNVETIGDMAFSLDSQLTSLVIPDSVISIGSMAFAGNTGLKSITIGKGLKIIGSSAFPDCTQLTEVYYNGTASDWSNISIDSNGNSPLTSTTRYYYSETQPTDTTNKYWHYDTDGITIVKW